MISELFGARYGSTSSTILIPLPAPCGKVKRGLQKTENVSGGLALEKVSVFLQPSRVISINVKVDLAISAVFFPLRS